MLPYYVLNGTHCSKLGKVLNENDTPQNQQFLLVYTPVVPKQSTLQKSVDIQWKKEQIRIELEHKMLKFDIFHLNLTSQTLP